MILKTLRSLLFLLTILSPFQVSAGETPIVEFKTTAGDFRIALNPEAAPETVANFLQYVRDGFYEDTLFHRTIAGFMIQGGGFDQSLNRKATRDPIINESGNGLANERGTIAMARTSAPNSATSQFFINVVDNAPLNARGGRPGYAVFGKVIEGMDVVDKIATAPTFQRGQFANFPVEKVVIESVSLIEAP